MTLLTPDLAPLFWEEQKAQGLSPEDLDSGRVTDLGRRLCEFMNVRNTSVEIITLQVQEPVEELSQAS